MATGQPICADPDLGLIYEWVHAIEDALTAQGAFVGGESPRDQLYAVAREWVLAYGKMSLDERRAAVKWGNDALCGGPLVDSGPVCADEPGPVLPRVTAWVAGVDAALLDMGWDGSLSTPTDRLRRASFQFVQTARALTEEQVAAFDAGCAMRVRARTADGWITLDASNPASRGSDLVLKRSDGAWILSAPGVDGVPSWKVEPGSTGALHIDGAPVEIRRLRP